MKKTVFAVLIPLILVLSLPSALPAFAADKTAEPVSPALSVLAGDAALAVSGESGSSVKLNAEAFEKGLGVGRVRSVTILSLPPITEGRLMLGQSEVVRNQVVSRSALSELCFLPSGDGSVTSSFTFRAGDAMPYEMTFNVYCLDAENGAPVPSSAEKIETLADISCFGCLNASDPDGDPVTYRISAYPENGLLVLEDAGGGDFTYTPVSGFTGRDSFRYTVTDRYGSSTEARITVTVSENESGILLTDMIGKYGHGEAIAAVDAGIMDCRIEMGSRYFSPDEEISRLDFLVSAMKACGYRIATTVGDTGFADDASIPAERKGYVSAAVKMGFITGIEEDGKQFFLPGKPVTFDEASVILNGILALPVPVSAVSEPPVPDRASEAYACMCVNGLFPAGGRYAAEPEKVLDRADAAVLLNRVSEYRKANP